VSALSDIFALALISCSGESPFACSVSYAVQYCTRPSLLWPLDAQGRNNNNVRPLKTLQSCSTSSSLNNNCLNFLNLST
jgi:hypothetical protein